MFLSVYANGSNNGENTHVSVFAQIMAGDNDDQLQWPFFGDIDRGSHIEKLQTRGQKVGGWVRGNFSQKVQALCKI